MNISHWRRQTPVIDHASPWPFLIEKAMASLNEDNQDNQEIFSVHENPPIWWQITSPYILK